MRFSLILLGSVLALACSKSNNNPNSEHSCNFAVTAITAPSAGSVKYEANVSGSGTITTLVFKNASGLDSTISSPALPFQTTFNVAAATPIAISAVGSTQGGQIEIKYTFTATDSGTVTQDKQECGN